MSFNVKDAGWFYHAPARAHKNDDPVLYPPMSQIPGLTEDDALPPDDTQPRPLFRETDTKYVRLAKEGGRKNLLYMKENPSEKREPVGYPRNDWFYLHDNELEDAEEKEKTAEEYAFMRPDYMVHEPYKKGEENIYDRPKRGPIGFDRLSAFERDGHSATDKTVKLPELRKVGYGVRSEKPLKIPKTQQVGAKPPTAQTDPGRGNRPLKYLPMPSAGKSRERPRISKLLSYAYDREWHEELVDWQNKQDASKDKHRQMMSVPPHLQTEKPVSEYNISYGRREMPHGQQTRHEETALTPKSTGRKSHGAAVKQTESQKLREAKLKKQEEKELFKLTRFKNVSARIETHRHRVKQAPPAQQPQPQAACVGKPRYAEKTTDPGLASTLVPHDKAVMELAVADNAGDGTGSGEN